MEPLVRRQPRTETAAKHRLFASFAGARGCACVERHIDNRRRSGWHARCTFVRRRTRSVRPGLTACFGKKLVYGWRKCIQKFKILYKKSVASVTPKAYVVFRHVIEFCDHFGFGLGYYSEQPFESVHQDWKQIWEHMKVHDASNPRLLERLLLSLKLYNIRHF